MKNQWVKSLQPGHVVATYFGILDISIGKTKSGAKFLKLLMGDRTGTVEGRVWDPALAEDLYRELSPGDVAIVHGTVTEFNGLQVNIEACLKADISEIDINDFRPVTDKDIPEMLRKFLSLLDTVSNPHLRALLEAIFTPDFLEAFSTATAARQVHHAYAGGLIEHTIEVMEYCAKAAEVQGEGLNGDLLLAGAALHDIGKLWEYDQSGLTFRRTGVGQLLGGHVILGHDFLRDKLAELGDFPEGLAVHLDHLILSHHGQREWGAVEEPRTIEAVALHHADLMSARINQVWQAVKSHRGSDPWTSFDRRLGRSIYVPDRITGKSEL
ncbi:MAG: 3'-5' exoribonuclease YhaM family protein [Thermacetogeniaceae bacterium]